jgi:hypothetical protein
MFMGCGKHVDNHRNPVDNLWITYKNNTKMPENSQKWQQNVK